MNKDSLIGAIAEKSGLTRKDSEAALNAFIKSVSEALARKEKVTLIGFGTFSVPLQMSMVYSTKRIKMNCIQRRIFFMCSIVKSIYQNFRLTEVLISSVIHEI